MYLWQQVKALGTQGFHVKQISRHLKISRNTVKKYLRSSDPPQFHAREYKKKCDGYLAVIKEMIRKGFIGTRIHEELTAIGFTGSLSTVERIIQKGPTCLPIAYFQTLTIAPIQSAKLNIRV